jgi:exopolyphosphatase/guanosine-5'-triphosphate,3'-diphosphate pyrophosphatase
MPSNRRAVIDVGTNSVKLLVADLVENTVRPVMEDSEQTRLGAGFYEAHQLQPKAIADTAHAVATFAATARESGADRIRVVATSAARDAVNSAELTSAIRQASGLQTEIISGEQEADWVFRGVISDPQLAARPLLLLDVGGGSTEFILGQGGQKHFRQSLPLGTVRLLETLPHSDPATPAELATGRKWMKDFLSRELSSTLRPLLARENKANPARPVQLVGTGGTATILARMAAQLENYDRDRIETARIDLAAMKARVKILWSLPLEERKKITGLPKKRADVILAGAVIYEGVMEEFGFEELRVSTRGLRFAAVMDAA